MAHIAYNHTQAECNYTIYNKDLVARIKTLEEWRPVCEGVSYPHQFLMEHKNLEYLITKWLLNWKLTQCLEVFEMIQPSNHQ